MRLVPFADLATTHARRRWNCRAQFADWLPGDLVEALWQRPERLLSEGQVLQHRGVRHSVQVRWGNRDFVLKYYAEPSWRHGLKQLVTPSRARKTWNVMHLLADSGVLTPRPVACIEETWGPLQLNSYLLYPYVAGETVKHCLLTQPQPHSLVAELIPQFAELWDKLKAIDVSLADVNPGNFILGARRQLWVIDLDKARAYRNPRVAEERRQSTWQRLHAEIERVVQINREQSGNVQLRRAA